MKYPIGYNSETRTCQFIEEFNSGASFRMWMNKGKTHVEVFTPDMKRRKEKDFSPHIKSLNEYVSNMYAIFNSYKPKNISAALYINCFGDKYLRSVDLDYIESIDVATLRIGQLELDKDVRINPFTSKVFLDYLNKVKDSFPSVLDRAFGRLSEKADSILHRGQDSMPFSYVDELVEIPDYIIEATRNRQLLVDAIVWHYKVLNGLIEDETVEVTQASNGRLSIILVNGEAVVVYSLYDLNEENFIMSSLVEKDKYPVILQEYKDSLVSADYDEMLNQMNKTPYSNPRQEIFDLMENKGAPKDLFRHESLFAKGGHIPRLGNPFLDQSPITRENVMREIDNLYEKSKNRGILGKRKGLKD